MVASINRSNFAVRRHYQSHLLPSSHLHKSGSLAQEKRRRRIYNHQRPCLILTRSLQHRVHDLSIRIRVATTQVIKFSSLKAKVLRPDLKSPHTSIYCFRNVSLSRQSDLIQAIISMDHPRTLRAERRQHLGELVRQILSPDADNLSSARLPDYSTAQAN